MNTNVRIGYDKTPFVSHIYYMEYMWSIYGLFVEYICSGVYVEYIWNICGAKLNKNGKKPKLTG